MAQGLLGASPGASPQGDAPRYRLRGALEVFFAADGDVYLLRGGSGREHVIRRPGPEDCELLRRLAAGSVELPAAGPVTDRLRPLIASGAVIAEPPLDALAPVDAQRFARQLPYFEDFGDPVAAQLALRAATVVVLGCGGLGTWALGALATAGVGAFVLIDDDAVELSNLNRQILYRAADVGVAKVDRVAAWLQAFDPSIAVETRRRRVEGPEDLADLAGADALLLTADWPPYEITRWVNAVALAARVPFVIAGQQPPLVKVGPTYLPGDGPCFACHETALRRDFDRYDELADHRRHDPPPATTLGPASALVGSLLALEVMHLILGVRPLATHGREMIIDLRTLQVRWQAVQADPGCPSCATVPPPRDGG